MIFNKKFSVLDAYVVSAKVILEYISFYIVWYGALLVASFVSMVWFGVYADILNVSALTENFSWVSEIVKRWLSDIKFDASSIPNDLTIYGLISHVLPKSILNHTIETMSWSEYFNIIVMPKKIILLSAIIGAACASMTVSIGFIKTALAFQSKQKASFCDMYQYFYLVPSYFATRLAVMFASFTPILAILVIHNYLGMFKYLLFAVSIVAAIFVYQRLRFAKYLVIDQGENPVHACIASWNLTRGSVFHLLVYSVCSVVLMAPQGSMIFLFLATNLDKQAEVSLYRQMMSNR